MAADAWKKYNTFAEYIGDGTVDLDNDTFKCALFTSAYTPNAESDSTYAGISANEVANGNGYTTGGFTLTATWTRSTGTVTFDSDNPNWTASGGAITARYAVIYSSTGGELAAYCLLDNSPADVSVTSGNTLTITINASGIFTLSGMA